MSCLLMIMGIFLEKNSLNPLARTAIFMLYILCEISSNYQSGNHWSIHLLRQELMLPWKDFIDFVVTMVETEPKNYPGTRMQGNTST